MVAVNQFNQFHGGEGGEEWSELLAGDLALPSLPADHPGFLLFFLKSPR